MKNLFKDFIGVAVLILLFLITASFLKKEYVVEKSITINKPKTAIFNYIRYLKN